MSRLWYSLLLLALALPAPAAEPEDGLPGQAITVLRKHCHRCHGVELSVPGFNVLDRAGLVAPRDGKKPFVTPGKPEESALWLRAGVKGTMPPADVEARPLPEEKKILEKWIADGAIFPEIVRAGTFQGPKEVLTAMRDHLRRTGIKDRPFQRFFTFTNLSNNPAVSRQDLRVYRAALSKLVNSLSWKPDIVVPRAIDGPEGSVYVIDLRDLGWDENDLWQAVLKSYPYGLKHTKDADEAVRDLAKEVYDMAGSELPYLRADWFVASASKPPLYFTLLQLPEKAADLEKELKVDVVKGIQRNKVARAGFATSGVSSQNRVVERHGSSYGAYWKSYDFKANTAKGDIVRFPLGPIFKDHPNPDLAFVQDGGETIYSLPNRLHGYYLVNGKDERIESAPSEVVSDLLKTAGTSVVHAGLSCFGCHRHGMIRCKDAVRSSNALSDEARDSVRQLYSEQDALDKWFKKDEDAYLGALEEAIAPFLKKGEKAFDVREAPEPISALVRTYLRDVGLAEAAFELGLDDPKELKEAIKRSRQLRELGLGPLVEGNPIKRAKWESVEGFTSPYQDAARELERGTPYRPR